MTSAARPPAAVGPVPYRLAADTIAHDEIEAAKAVLDSGRFTMGPRVRQFEEEFAAWVGAREAVMVNSGSSANLLMAEALTRGTRGPARLAPGDEVLVPALAWPTTVWPIVQHGLVPVFVDIEPNTLGLSLESARATIGPRTRAMFLIHPLGRALDMMAIEGFCRTFNLELLEDSCESLGSFWSGRHVGTFGLAGSFSFYFSHHLSTIEGGMVVTEAPELADDLRSFRAHGWVRDRSDRVSWAHDFPDIDSRFLFATTGYNVRPMELQGAIGSVQLRRLDTMLEARARLARDVAGWLAQSAPWLELVGGDTISSDPTLPRRTRSHSWMTLPLRLAEDAPVARDTLMNHLELQGVETRPVIAGNLARHPAARRIPHRVAASLKESDAVLDRALMIGCHPVLAPGARATLERAIASLAEL